MSSFILNFHIPFHISQSEQDYFPQNERRCFSWENATQLLINLGLLPVVLHILIRSQSETVWYFSLCQINMLHLNIHLNMFYNSNSAENKRVCIIHLLILQHTLRGGGKKNLTMQVNAHMAELQQAPFPLWFSIFCQFVFGETGNEAEWGTYFLFLAAHLCSTCKNVLVLWRGIQLLSLPQLPYIELSVTQSYCTVGTISILCNPEN